MKYLKKYKLFESITKNDVIEKLGFDPELILDLLVPFEDMGCEIYLMLIGEVTTEYGESYTLTEKYTFFMYSFNSQFNTNKKIWNKKELGECSLDTLKFKLSVTNKSNDSDFSSNVEELIEKLKTIFEKVAFDTLGYNFSHEIDFSEYKNKR